MKLLSSFFFCSLIFTTINSKDMTELLKSHIKNEDTVKIIQLLKENPNILEVEDTNGSSVFMLLAYSGLEKPFKEAIEMKDSFTFYEAIVIGKIEIVNNYLEDKNIEIVNTHSNDGFTPLSLATFFNQTEIAKLIVEFGADPNIQAKNPSKVNALHSAVAKENIELCNLFINKGADVNLTQTQNVTPLHAAVHTGNLELTQMLIENGASIESAMDNGDTPLTIAKRDGHKHIEVFLIKMQN